MYFVDRNKIENTLRYMETCVDETATRREWRSDIEQLALERLAHVVIESILDVGNQMIDGFIMRDPGSYEDIIEILNDENVLPDDDAASLKAVIALRKQLVRDYTAVDHSALQQTLKNQLEALQSFPYHVKRYLEDELGPVSAFLPDEDEKS